MLPELVKFASFSHGSIQTVRDAILLIPKEEILARIEQIAEPILITGDYDEYRRLLELYILLDKELTRKLALRAANDPDPDIKEAGEDFL